jgi:ech hydrogenase subunit A
VNELIFLILFPFLAALLLLVVRREKFRRAIGYAAAFVILAVSAFLVFSNLSGTAQYFSADSELINRGMLIAEGLIAVLIAYVSIRSKKYIPLILVILQTAVLVFFEVNWQDAGGGNALFVDNLSLVMALIIGVIGSLICIYSFGYMRDFHSKDKELKDRRGVFFFVMFAFLGAMFGLVFSNNLLWLYFFWELTTICSFILIGYTRTPEAKNNAFRALTFNLLGGLAFIIAILYLGATGSGLGLDQIMQMDKAIVLLPVVLISFAGLTKSAQLPFSSWLVGAMVAPTPVSALLHSSTMVKAGVYVMIRFAPLLQGSVAGVALSLVGGSTFLIASAIAISQSNAKKVLAYSTIATLGLITACAGVGTYEAVWAAIFLLIFHAVAKSLMFLSVGTVEHRIGSRDIDDMEGLAVRMPKIAIMMLVGIAGMFLAPFGMLISKWATLRAFIDVNPVLFGIAAFGSGMTVFFWAKWMGKIVSVHGAKDAVKERTNRDETIVLAVLAALTIVACVAFPLISQYVVEPFVAATFGISSQMGQGNLITMFMMLAAVLILPFSVLYFRKRGRELPAYMSARPSQANRFSGTAGLEKELELNNYYLDRMFGEARLMKIGVMACALLSLFMFIFAFAAFAGVLP